MVSTLSAYGVDGELSVPTTATATQWHYSVGFSVPEVFSTWSSLGDIMVYIGMNMDTDGNSDHEAMQLLG